MSMGNFISNTTDFIFKAKKVHGDKYNYSEVEYIRAIQKVQIVCELHGLFLQQPKNHLSGYGCQRCAIERTALNRVNEIEYFIEKSNNVHNNKYDYSLIIKGQNEIPVKIICPIHGIFSQPPIRHLYGKGCKKCATEKTIKPQTYTVAEWIIRANEIHKFIYDYSLVEYKNKNTKINIVCKLHGAYSQTPHNHLYGNGCPICAKIIQNYAYKRTNNPDSNKIPCSIYIIKLNNKKECFYKIGISTNLLYRFREINSTYKVTIIKLLQYNLFKCVSLEQYVLRALNGNKYLPILKFGGYKECLNINPLTELLKQVDEFHTARISNTSY